MLRIYQYILRVANVVLFAFPWNYRKKKLQILGEMYHLSVNVLSKLNEPFWLDFGTLLGCYREGDIIPHDIDIDVSMMETSYEKVRQLRGRMPPGLILHDTSSNHKGPKLYFSYKGFDFDIFFYKSYGDRIKCYLEGAAPNETQFIQKELVFPLKPAVFKEKSVWVPNHTREYLEQMYGYIGNDGTRNSETGFWSPPS